MAEEIQEAVQIIRVAYDGIEIAMKDVYKRQRQLWSRNLP